MSQAYLDVGVERNRQISELGYDIDHDEQYRQAELIRAAVTYALASAPGIIDNSDPDPNFWPWDTYPFKDKGSYYNLCRAAALIIAEMDRLNAL